MKGEYTKLDELTKDNPELNAAVNRSSKTIDQVNDAIKAVTAALIAGNSSSFMDAVKQSESMSALEMNWYSQELALIGKTEDDYAEQSIEKQAALRRQLIKYVIFLIAANSALSILMALFLVRNSTRTMGLINDLLDSQKIQSGMMTLHAEELQLADSFEEVQLSMANLVSEYGIHLQVKAVDIQVLANRDMLNRILFNLISNALKYSPKGGSIFLEAKATGELPK